MDDTLRKINIYIKAGTDFKKLERPGYYNAVMVDVKTKNIKKIEHSVSKDTTPNRLMILAAIEMVKLLKYPCEITIFTTTAIGWKRRKGVNKELLTQLFELANEGNHILSNNYDNPDIVRSIAAPMQNVHDILVRLDY